MPYQRFYKRSDWGARPWKEFETQLKSKTTEVFIHHGAEANAQVVDHLAEQKTTMKEIQNFHMDTRGWDDIAYHYVIFQEYGNIPVSRVFSGRPPSHVPAAQLNHNTNTIAICIYGNYQHDDQFKASTRFAITRTIKMLKSVGYPLHTIGGHRDVVQTTCPGDTVYAQISRMATLTGLKTYA